MGFQLLASFGTHLKVVEPKTYSISFAIHEQQNWISRNSKNSLAHAVVDLHDGGEVARSGKWMPSVYSCKQR
jgi:hypothetical protein